MVRRSRRGSPARTAGSPGAKCAWKRHRVTFPAEGISRRRVTDGRRVRSCAPGPRIPRLPMRFRLRRASRRSHGSLQQTGVAVSPTPTLRASAQDERRRPGAAVQQTMKAARRRQWTKRGADHLREDQAWSERHGIEQQMSATRFAAPSFSCLRNRCSRAATLRCATSRNDACVSGCASASRRSLGSLQQPGVAVCADR